MVLHSDIPAFTRFVLGYRLAILLALVGIVGWLGVFVAPRVEKSYDYISSLPQGSSAEQEYMFFRKHFPHQGGEIVFAVQSRDFFRADHFRAYTRLCTALRQIKGVASVLSVCDAVYLTKSAETEQFIPHPIFPTDDHATDSARAHQARVLASIPLYTDILYNPRTQAYLCVLDIDRAYVFSKKRETLVRQIDSCLAHFRQQAPADRIAVLGLPYMRTKISDIIASEIRSLLLTSIVFLLVIIALTFRTVVHVLISAAVLGCGLVFAFSTIVLLDYRLSLLNGIVPTLVVVIGVPNCIYFFYVYAKAACTTDKYSAIATMLKQMGKITLLCNLTTALGFFVFIFTSSPLLREFALVASINILLLFAVTYLLLPVLLSYFPAPTIRKHDILETGVFARFVQLSYRLTRRHPRTIVCIFAALLGVSIWGISRLYSNSYLVDDLPQNNAIRDDVRFFETHFRGMIPLEILLDTKKKSGAVQTLSVLHSVDLLTRSIDSLEGLSRSISAVDGLKFLRQMYYNADSAFYALPNQFDIGFLAPYLQEKATPNRSSNVARILSSVMDTNRQILRIHYRVADIGQQHTAALCARVREKINRYIDTASVSAHITGESVTLLAANQYLIGSLRESILWACLFLVLFVAYVFWSFKMLWISMVANVIPLAFSAGLLGCLRIALNPALVIIFSITLGIAIDVTIRLLMQFYLFNKRYHNTEQSIRSMINQSGISVVYTTLILVGGFCIFVTSPFSSLRYLGLITGFTLICSTFANLFLLPILLRWISKDNSPEKI